MTAPFHSLSSKYLEEYEIPDPTPLRPDPRGSMRRAYEGVLQLSENAGDKEIPRNAIQAYLASFLRGPIYWDFLKVGENELGEALYVPCFYDLAGGLRAQEMRNHLQILFNSGGIVEGKHGLGGRNSVLRAMESFRLECEKAGLPPPPPAEWWSLRDGIISGFQLWIETPEIWNSRVYEDVHLEDFNFTFPQEILDAGHGTLVVFFGVKPLTAKEMPSETKIKSFSKRWYDLPEGITIKAKRQRSGEHGTFVDVPTQKQALEALSDVRYTTDLSDCKVITYILKENLADVPGGERYHYADLYRTKDGGGAAATPKAKIGVVYENELYSYTEGGGVHNQLRLFGITHGQRRIVMILFPDTNRYKPDLLRNRLVPSGIEPTSPGKKEDESVDLPIKRWQKEFNTVMPEELRQYVEDAAIGTAEQNMEIINTVIASNAKDISGCGRRRKVIRKSDGDTEVSKQKPGRQNEREPNPDPGGDPGPKKPPKKVPGVLSNKGKSKQFTPPKVIWITPSPDDHLYAETGIFLPDANKGVGELQLNRNWPGFIKWRNRLMATIEEESDGEPHSTTPTMLEHFTEQTMAFIHIDIIMRSRRHKLPDPSCDDFRHTMLLPCMRDIAYEKILKASAKVLRS